MGKEKKKHMPETRKGRSQKQHDIIKPPKISDIRNKETYMPETRRGAKAKSKTLKPGTTKTGARKRRRKHRNKDSKTCQEQKEKRKSINQEKEETKNP